METVTAGAIVDRPGAMQIPTTVVDGMDVWATRAAALETIARIRAGEGPMFVEARTYRFVGHSRSDPGKYRPEGELEEWQARDPLVLARARLHDELGVGEDDLQAIADDVERELASVEEAALAAPFPEPAPFPEFKA
jgi:TPP-dependent pyruvate/acetoin dehydrogenase alpha subunit